MKSFAVIGLDTFGDQVARTLFQQGHEVIAIDPQQSRVDAIGEFVSEAVVADPRDRDALASLGLESMDAVLVTARRSLSTSILTCLYLQELEVKNVLATAVDDDHQKILKRVGASTIILPEREMAERTARGMVTPHLVDLITLAEGYEIAELDAPEAWWDKTIGELNLTEEQHVHVISVRDVDQGEFTPVPGTSFTVEKGDTIILLGKTDDIKNLRLGDKDVGE